MNLTTFVKYVGNYKKKIDKPYGTSKRPNSEYLGYSTIGSMMNRGKLI
jgi:hypothetical protein